MTEKHELLFFFLNIVQEDKMVDQKVRMHPSMKYFIKTLNYSGMFKES